MSFNAFELVSVRNVTFRNRFLTAPMATQYADKLGRVTETLLKYYQYMAECGTGCVIVEGAAVDFNGRGWSRELGAWSSEFLSGLSELADAIKSRGTAAFLQLHHAGRQALPPREGEYVVAPSAISCPVLNRPTRALSNEEIKRLIDKFVNTAGLAAEAGFDGVELHGAHGYLLHQFCSPLTNKRTDEYCLEPNGISKFPLAVVKAVRSDFPNLAISYRMSVRDYLPGGLTLKQSVNMAKALEGAGVDIIHVSGGMYASLHGPESLVGPATPQGVFVDDARDIREAVSIPVAVVGKIGDHALAAKIMANEDAHFIALGRVLLRDPHWVDKMSKRNRDSVVNCLLCRKCQYHMRGCPDGSGEPSWCRVVS